MQGEANSLKVHQDVKVFAGLLNGAERFSHEVSAKRYAYVHIASGELMLNGEHLREGDGVRVRTATQLSFSEGKNAEILVFDLANHELPELA